MTRYTVRAGLIFVALGCSPAFALKPVTARSSLDCRSFHLEVETTFVDTGVFGQGKAQKIVLTNPHRQITVSLDLQPHRSPDPELGGRMALDGLAFDWRCIKSKSGDDFLLLGFVCANDGARSCSVDMRSPSSERQQVYDATGRPLLKNPVLQTPKEVAHLEDLGLWSQFLMSVDKDHIQFVYR